MNTPIQFEVLGNPKGQPRPKAFARKFGNGKVMARVYDPGTAEGWKSQIAIAVRDLIPTPPLDGPIRLTIEFRLPRPKAHYHKVRGCLYPVLRDDAPHWHIGKPDTDNMTKAVKDCLTTLGMWRDDSQVCDEHPIKIYGERPGMTVVISRIGVNQ